MGPAGAPVNQTIHLALVEFRSKDTKMAQGLSEVKAKGGCSQM